MPMLQHDIISFVIIDSYCVWMLQEVLEQTRGKSIDLYLMYDVACMLQKHLQVCCSEIC